jgi:hypothetical protein
MVIQNARQRMTFFFSDLIEQMIHNGAGAL